MYTVERIYIIVLNIVLLVLAVRRIEEMVIGSL